MRKIILMIAVMTTLLASCGYDNPIDKDLSNEMDEIMITPSSIEFYLDTEIPYLTVMRIPAYAKDTTVTWSSSRPDLIKIDPTSGKMEVIQREPTQVKVVATSRDGGHSSFCTFNLRMITTPMEWYIPMDLKKDFGLWLLDRSIGSAKSDERLQWGRNTPCWISRQYPTGQPGSVNWSADVNNKEYCDWTKPDKTRCPKGWRIPTRKELELIASKVNKTAEMSYDEQKSAELLFQKLKIKDDDYGYATRYPSHDPWGDKQINESFYQWFDIWGGWDESYWFSCERVAPEDQEGTLPQVYALHLNKNNTAKVVKVMARIGGKVRCVK
ncbi:MAG: hypothetical protein RSA53_05625 [Odoribacter sp.]